MKVEAKGTIFFDVCRYLFSDLFCVIFIRFRSNVRSVLIGSKISFTEYLSEGEIVSNRYRYIAENYSE